MDGMETDAMKANTRDANRATAQLVPSSAPAHRCEHADLKLERGSTYNYLTGWYVCQQCGERLLAR